MQDKDKNMEKWADRGWGEMAALLDAEMPARHRRRWVIWWWLPLLLLPALMMSWFFFHNTQPEQEEPALHPVAQLDNSTASGTGPFAGEAQKKKSKDPAEMRLAPSGPEKAIDQQDGRVLPFAGAAAEREAGLMPAPVREETAETISENVVDQALPGEGVKRIRWAEALPLIPGLAETPVLVASFPEQPPKVRTRQSRGFSAAPRFWEVSLQAAANPDYAFGGVGAALEAVYPLGRKGWLLRPGIFYLHQQQDIDIEENSDYNQRVGEAFNQAPLPGGPLQSETLQMDVVGFTLGVSHHPSAAWSLRGGLGVGWIIEPDNIVHTQASDEESLVNDPASWVNADQLTAELQDLRAQLVEEEGLNRQLWFVSLGVSRQITSRLSLRADLQWGLNDLSRDSFFGQSRFDGLHQFRLGLGYRW